MRALLANSIPDEPREPRAWIDDLPVFEGDEGLRCGGTWPEEYLQEFAKRERARRVRLTTEFAEFIGNQFAIQFIKEATNQIRVDRLSEVPRLRFEFDSLEIEGTHLLRLRWRAPVWTGAALPSQHARPC